MDDPHLHFREPPTCPLLVFINVEACNHEYQQESLKVCLKSQFVDLKRFSHIVKLDKGNFEVLKRQ